MPQFHCDLDQRGSALAHVWSHTVGSGHARLGLRADWQAQLRRARAELGVRYVRFHGILDDDMATLLNEGDELRYGFYNIDQVFDFLRAIGMRPFVELSFMPTALASGHKTVFNYRGNITPPKDMEAWAALIDRLARHWVDRYGIDEVRTWFFEVWNEPNLAAFWSGGQAGYFELYRRTATTLKAVDSKLRVGGPATANDEWIGDFKNYCASKGVPCDFISTHHYPTDALGEPGDDTEAQLALADRSVLRTRTLDTCAAAGDLPVYYTEWCSSSNPFFHRHDEPYAAAFIVKNFLDVAGLVEAYSYWTFSDLFAENYFSSVPFHGGFGLLTIHGIAKPAYRGVQLLAALGDERLLVDGGHKTVDATVVRGVGGVTVLLTNHAFPTHPISAERVRVTLRNAGAPERASITRVDDDHCNPRRLWESMGSPNCPDAEQLQRLCLASEPQRDELAWVTIDGGIVVELDLPPHAIAAVTLAFPDWVEGAVDR